MGVPWEEWLSLVLQCSILWGGPKKSLELQLHRSQWAGAKKKNRPCTVRPGTHWVPPISSTRPSTHWKGRWPPLEVPPSCAKRDKGVEICVYILSICLIVIQTNG